MNAAEIIVHENGSAMVRCHRARKRANGPGDGVRTRNLPINNRMLCRIELRRDGRYRGIYGP